MLQSLRKVLVLGLVLSLVGGLWLGDDPCQSPAVVALEQGIGDLGDPVEPAESSGEDLAFHRVVTRSGRVSGVQTASSGRPRKPIALPRSITFPKGILLVSLRTPLSLPLLC